MKTLFIILILAMANPAINAQSLWDYRVEAAQNSPALKAVYAEFEAALQKIPQAGALPDPTLSFGYFIMPVETRLGPQRARFSLTQMFPWFGTLKAQKEIAALNADVCFQTFVEARNKLYYEVGAAWYPMVALKRQMSIVSENMGLLELYKKLATSHFENGKGSMVDVLRVDLLLSESETDLQILEQQMSAFQVRFNQLLNRSDSTAIALPDSLVFTKIPEAYRKDSLLAKNPGLAALESSIQAAQAREILVQKQGMPKVGLGLDYVVVSPTPYQNPANNGRNIFMPMLSVSLPVYRAAYRASVAESELMSEASAYKKEALGNELQSGYAMAWFKLQQQAALLALYNQQIVVSRQSLKLLYSAYSTSGSDFEEVLRMQQQLLRYRNLQATALSNYYTALAELDYLTAKTP
ncbi:TolC family protein [bacterium]|nr:TolC family protein [bacterium]